MTAALDLPELLTQARRLAEQAGREIMAIFRDEARWQVQHKEDDSPLTAADLAAHRVIVAGLSALTPDIPVISEESDAIPVGQRLGWTRCWLVDPLDGTKEFIARSRDFTVNIALVENGEAILGVVYAPALERAYVATRGGGAHCLEGEASRRLASAKFPAAGARPLRLVASRRHRGERDAAFCNAVEAAFGPVQFSTAGSAFKLCVVAEGEADAYPRFGPTMEWDTAAGQVVVEEAGGVVVDERGRPFRYNRRDTLRNGNFLVLGDAPEKWLAVSATLDAQS